MERNGFAVPAEKLETDETAYLKLSNERYLRFAWSGEEPRDAFAKGTVEYNCYTPDGAKELENGIMDVADTDASVFQIVQLLAMYMGYRDETSAPIMYLPLPENTFHAEVAAA